ncbi:chromosomal replication initiator DnaA [Rhodobacteraceae bacterium 63075]|nr:chromosomal replication initiator DnaA [Rhodobacteraceae bacterium 63075]
MSRQLTFDLPARTALGREDFFVTEANAAAVAMIEGWESWPSGKLMLTGPSGSGKTHLAHVWAALSGARIVDATALPGADMPALASGPIAIEDIGEIAGDRAAQEALFHLHNLAQANGEALLLTAHAEPQHLSLTLPDLQSRLQAAPAAPLREPDDALLSAVLMKLFADRQLVPKPDVIPYLTRHMPRSFAAARSLVEALDSAALSEGRDVTRALARSVLES